MLSHLFGPRRPPLPPPSPTYTGKPIVSSGNTIRNPNSTVCQNWIFSFPAMELEFRCINCGHPVEKLYIQYSPGNIRLSKCEVCRSISDEYVECELMIIVIDLILHKPKAYRHLLFNTLSRQSIINSDSDRNTHMLFKSLALFFLLDACKPLVPISNREGRNSVYASELKIMGNALLGNLVFLGSFAGLARKLLNLVDGFHGYKDVVLAVLVSSYLKVFTVAMLVWTFPALVVYVVDLFVVSSNLVALRVISEPSSSSSSLSRCANESERHHFRIRRKHKRSKQQSAKQILLEEEKRSCLLHIIRLDGEQKQKEAVVGLQQVGNMETAPADWSNQSAELSLAAALLTCCYFPRL
ncbi:hypothetical protein Dimus_014519 [Dionaea muscipula]